MTMAWLAALLLALTIALIVASAVGSRRFRERYEAEKAELIRRAMTGAHVNTQQAAVAGLPAPVRRYLEVTRSLDAARPRIATLKQRGSLRASPDGSWMPFESEQVYSFDPPGFVWLARARIAPLIAMHARDKFVDAHGNMLISLLGAFTIADGRGREMDLGAGLRYWGEVIAFPQMVLDPHLHWEPIDAQEADLSIEQGALKMHARVAFGAPGFPVSIHAARYRDVGGTQVLTRWSGHTRDWKLLDGRMFPTSWESVWHLPGGDFSAVKMEVLSVRIQ